MPQKFLDDFIRQILKNNNEEGEEFFQKHEEKIASFIHKEIPTNNFKQYYKASFYTWSGHNYDTATPLYIATILNSDVIVKLLLKHGANIDELSDIYKDHNAMVSAVEAACMIGSTKILNILLEHGADISGQIGINCLYFSMSHNEITQILCKKGADVNGMWYYNDNSYIMPQYDDCNYLINAAIFRCEMSFIEIIVENGADVQLVKDYYLFNACLKFKKKKCDILPKLSNDEALHLIKILDAKGPATIAKAYEVLGIRYLEQGNLTETYNNWTKAKILTDTLQDCKIPPSNITVDKINNFDIIDSCLYALVIFYKYFNSMPNMNFKTNLKTISQALSIKENSSLFIDTYLYHELTHIKNENDICENDSNNIDLKNLQFRSIQLFIKCLNLPSTIDSITWKRWIDTSLNIIQKYLTMGIKLSCENDKHRYRYDDHYVISDELINIIALINFIITFSTINMEPIVKQLIALSSNNQCCTLLNTVVIYELLLKYSFLNAKIDYQRFNIIQLFIACGIDVKSVDCKKNSIIHRIVDNINTLYDNSKIYLEMVKYGKEYIAMFRDLGVNAKNSHNVTVETKITRIKKPKHVNVYDSDDSDDCIMCYSSDNDSINIKKLRQID